MTEGLFRTWCGPLPDVSHLQALLAPDASEAPGSRSRTVPAAHGASEGVPQTRGPSSSETDRCRVGREVDLALAIFNVGAGLGVLAAGAALAYLAWQTTPLIRESRALTADLRRLARLTETEIGPLLGHARELASNVEVLSEDVAVKLDRVTDLMNSLQQGLDTGQVTAIARIEEQPRVEEAPRWETPYQESRPFWEDYPRPAEPAPVESGETREERSGS